MPLSTKPKTFFALLPICHPVETSAGKVCFVKNRPDRIGTVKHDLNRNQVASRSQN